MNAVSWNHFYEFLQGDVADIKKYPVGSEN